MHLLGTIFNFLPSSLQSPDNQDAREERVKEKASQPFRPEPAMDFTCATATLLKLVTHSEVKLKCDDANAKLVPL